MKAFSALACDLESNVSGLESTRMAFPLLVSRQKVLAGSFKTKTWLDGIPLLAARFHLDQCSDVGLRLQYREHS